MTKRFLSVMAMVSVVAMMMLSSCDTVNTDSDTKVDVSLIGKWECEKDESIYTYEITADDKIFATYSYESEGETNESKMEGKIKSIDEKEITYEYKDKELKIKYKVLSSDSVKFEIGDDNYQEFKKVK